MRTAPHNVTRRALAKRNLTDRELAMLIGCTGEHASDLMAGRTPPASRELAIMRICSNVVIWRLRAILDDLDENSEWRRIPGFSRYEASRYGQVRRSAAGHGSMPGHILRPKRGKEGHLFINAATDDGAIKTLGVHRAVCLAFHGEPPAPGSVARHENDISDDNRPENLLWGTHQDNADDRIRNQNRRQIDTKLTRRIAPEEPETAENLRKRTKAAMLYRL